MGSASDVGRGSQRRKHYYSRARLQQEDKVAVLYIIFLCLRSFVSYVQHEKQMFWMVFHVLPQDSKRCSGGDLFLSPRRTRLDDNALTRFFSGSRRNHVERVRESGKNRRCCGGNFIHQREKYLSIQRMHVTLGGGCCCACGGISVCVRANVLYCGL